MGLPSSIDPSLVARITRAQYDRFVETGALDGARVELLEGVIVHMAPRGPEHAGTVQILANVLRRVVGGRADVREEKPFVASVLSEPEPDIAVVPRGDTRDAHPDRALLVVEVADTSLAVDRRAKAAIYAGSSVPEYWIVNLRDRTVEVHTDARDGAYASARIARRGEELSLVALDGARVAIDDFLR